MRSRFVRSAHLALAVLPAIATLWFAQSARAGGWDTPMLYSARHMGMGGAAVSYVRDPSAIFHNPAGLAHTRRASVLGDFSLLLGTIQATPRTAPPSITSNTTVAPFFLVGGAFRPLSFLTAGIAVYPVASAGATYEYTRGMGDTVIEDTTRILFIEVSPAIALQLPMYPQLSIGFGWRFTLVSLDRTQGEIGGDPSIDLALTGTNLAGFRVGVQWQPIPQLQVGAAYRHKTVTDLSADTATFVGAEVEGGATGALTLPSRLTFGVRGNVAAFSAAADVEIGFNSQNYRADIDLNGFALTNIADWSDALTFRLGVEYRIGLGGVVRAPAEPDRHSITGVVGRATDATATTSRRIVISPRLGYVLDLRTSSRGYPSAFGTPPTHTMVLTGGVGLDIGGFEANLAVGHRFGSVTVTDQDVSMSEPCTACGEPGDYAINLTGIYVDVGYDFE